MSGKLYGNILINCKNISKTCNFIKQVGTSDFLINKTKYVYNFKRNFSINNNTKMWFVQFNINGGPQRLGAQLKPGGDIIDISAVDTKVPNSLVKFLASGDRIHAVAKRTVAAGSSVVNLSNVNLLSPITKPDKVACVGLNYSGHCKEQKVPFPKEPMIFDKFPSTIIGPHDNIILPTISNSVDWEVELAIVIGKKVKTLDLIEPMIIFFGYTVAQDISARDWQKERNNGQFLLGKSMDTFCPLGPAVVTKESIKDPHNLNIKCWVNGELKQSGNTKELIFKVDFIVSYLSQVITLYPGDVILTGTPAGVGMSRNPPEFLQKGDILESEIEGIGRLRNVIV